MTTKITKKDQQAVARFNKNPVGTKVLYWPILKRGDGTPGVTRAPAENASDGTPVVWIEGVSAYVALSHVEVVK